MSMSNREKESERIRNQKPIHDDFEENKAAAKALADKYSGKVRLMADTNCLHIRWKDNAGRSWGHPVEYNVSTETFKARVVWVIQKGTAAAQVSSQPTNSIGPRIDDIAKDISRQRFIEKSQPGSNEEEIEF